MNEKPVVIVYKLRERNLEPLKGFCEAQNLGLHIAENENEFKVYLRSATVICLIITVASDETWIDSFRDFIAMASNVFEPEDADINILYSLEGRTPEGWSKYSPTLNFEPRQIRSLNNLCYTEYDDNAWEYSIKRIKSLLTSDKNSGRVDICFAEESEVSFPTEALLLMRAAFKDKNSIIIEFPGQGLSGSIACIGHIIDDNNDESVFIKIYREDNINGLAKILKDSNNLVELVERHLEEGDYSKLTDTRRYIGRAYSLMVTDIVVGPGKRRLTLREMICSKYADDFTINKVKDFIQKVISIFDKWELKSVSEIDLIDAYLKDFLDDNKRRLNIESENVCHKWFGNFSDGKSLKDKIRNTIPKELLSSCLTKICHGDCHTENIMVKDIDGILKPVFIDFSRTGETHALKDLVTLESDMIIRGLGSIKHFSNQKTVASFLKAFFDDNNSRVNEWTHDAKELVQLKKVMAVITELRCHATDVYKSSLSEYECAALLKTLEVISYGSLPHDANVRATSYISYLIERLKKPGSPILKALSPLCKKKDNLS